MFVCYVVWLYMCVCNRERNEDILSYNLINILVIKLYFQGVILISASPTHKNKKHCTFMLRF